MNAKNDLVGRETKYVKILRKAAPDKGEPGGRHYYVMCECKSCGKKFFVESSSFRGNKKPEYDHCGCLHGREPKYPYVNPDLLLINPAVERLESTVDAFERSLKYCWLDINVPEDDEARQECINQLERGKKIIVQYIKKYGGEHHA